MLTQTTAVPVTYRHKRGRPRKVNVRRTANGKSLGEDHSLCVVFSQPHRAGAKDPNSSLLGYPLGRLCLSRQISEFHHRVGNEWGILVRAYAASIGARIGSPKSGSALSDAGKVAHAFSADAGTHGAEEYERRCVRLRTRYNACFERLIELGRVMGTGRQIIIAVRRVCIEEQYPSEEELGDLRIGLNALAAELGIKSR